MTATHTVSSALASSTGSTGTRIWRTWRLSEIPVWAAMSTAIIAKLSANESTKAPNTTSANVTLSVSRSVTPASASMPSPTTSGITA